MKICWLHKNGQKRLLVFCNGWGMDQWPFVPIAASACDVLSLHDFSDTAQTNEILTIISGYEQRVLIGWSMGVWGGQKLFADHEQLFLRTIAVNGTLCPVDDRLGIPGHLFVGTMENWSDSTRGRFYHRLCGDREVEKKFLANMPRRSLTDQQQELIYYLENADGQDRARSIYREIFISERDRIVPTANQIAFWGEERVIHLDGGHFPFYSWKSWDELLNVHGRTQ